MDPKAAKSAAEMVVTPVAASSTPVILTTALAGAAKRASANNLASATERFCTEAARLTASIRKLAIALALLAT